MEVSKRELVFNIFQLSFWAARAVRPRYLIEFDDGEELQVVE